MRYQNCESLSIIDGIPYFVSEDFEIDNLEILIGSNMEKYVCRETSKVIKTLKCLGAICLGCANSTILGSNVFGINLLENKSQLINPYNSKYYLAGGCPGLSYLVSTGLIAFAISYDKFGSLRLSSGSGGIVSIRPTYDKYFFPSNLYTNISLFWQTGIMAQSIEDLWIVYYYLLKDYRCNGKAIIPLNSPNLNISSLDKIKFGYFPEYINNAEKEFSLLYYDFLNIIISHNGVVNKINVPHMSETMAAEFFGEARNLYLLSELKFDINFTNIV